MVDDKVVIGKVDDAIIFIVCLLLHREVGAIIPLLLSNLVIVLMVAIMSNIEQWVLNVAKPTS